MVDINKPVNNSALRRAIAQMHRENTRQSQEQALEELGKAQLLAPVTVSATKGNQDAQVQFQLLTTQDGRSFFPAFTRREEMAMLDPEGTGQTLVLTFDNYAPMILRDGAAQGLVVDPFGDSLTLEKPMVAWLASQRGIISQQPRLRFSRPEQWPQELARAVEEQAAAMPEIRRIWLRQMEREDGRTSILLVVDHDGQTAQVFSAIAQTVQTHMGELSVDLVPYTEKLGQDAAREAEPFYQK